MSAGRALLTAAFLGWSAGAALAADELSRVWSDPAKSVRERADAVNRAFTNGTPVSVVVATLGTNYTLSGSSARLWAGSGPEPPNTFWLSYRFGEDEVAIETSAVFGRDLDPLSCKFTGAGYSFPVGSSTKTTNHIWIGKADESPPEWVKKSVEGANRILIGQPGGAVNRSQPVRAETNRTSSAAGSGR